MARRSHKAPLTDPRLAGLHAVERETAEEAQILRDIDASNKAPAGSARAKKVATRRQESKKT